MKTATQIFYVQIFFLNLNLEIVSGFILIAYCPITVVVSLNRYSSTFPPLLFITSEVVTSCLHFTPSYN